MSDLMEQAQYKMEESEKQLPGAEKSLMSKISEGISNVANTICNKVGLTEKPIVGHEDLDKKAIRQQKKVNVQIRKMGAKEGFKGNNGDEWMNQIPSELKKEIKTAKPAQLLHHVYQPGELDKKIVRQQKKINAEIIKMGAKEEFKGNKGVEWKNQLPEALKKEIKGVKIIKPFRFGKAHNKPLFQKLAGKTIEGHEDLDKKAIKQQKKVNAEIIKMGAKEGFEGNNGDEWVNQIPSELKKEIQTAKPTQLLQHVYQPGELDKKITKQQKIVNAEILKKGAEEGFEGNNGDEWMNQIPEDLKKEIKTTKAAKLLHHVPQPEDKPLTSANRGESPALGEKVKGALNDASQKIKSTFNKDTAVDKENARQIA